MKSIYFRNFTSTAAMVLMSFLMIGIAFVFLGRDLIISSHRDDMEESADVVSNSALIYELSVLKTYAEPLLFSVPKNAPEYQEAKRLLKFFDYFLAVGSEEIPRNSLLREFIGGSLFPVG